jgi:glycosidase
MTYRVRCIPLLLCALFFISQRIYAQDFKKQVIYQIITDRFYDGDTSNDNPPQSPGLFDATQTNWQLYWGGDFVGIQDHLSYIQGLGTTAIWISPPVDNINVSIPDSSGNPTAPYHGYSAHDDQWIEEHFGDINNTWTAFDNLASAAHGSGIKIIVDFAPNHSNPEDAGEYGALYNKGTFVGSYTNDPNGYYHHNPGISNFNDRYQLQYYTLEGLADFNQENPYIDSYLKTALTQFQQHGADAFRIDAVKHATWGWEYSMANTVFSNAPSFMFGEWFLGNTSDPLFPDSAKFANKSGISLLDFSLNTAVRDVFASNNNFSEIDGTLSQENSAFTWQNDLVTFVDNQDIPRFLSVNNNTNRLNEAEAFILTERGIPIIYYGDEQYLHNDTNGGGDPYNRPYMASYSTTTVPYQMIGKLAALRQQNDAIAYGTTTQRWINNDVYIYERQFYDDVVLVAINKNDTTSYPITGLNTALPAGSYSDYLTGLMGGGPLTVANGSNGNNPANNMTLSPHSVSVWQSIGTASGPEVGSIGPTVGQPGMSVTVAGQGFGNTRGSVLIGTVSATIQTWSNSSITFTIPGIGNGVYQAAVKTSSGVVSNNIQFTVLAAKMIPVTFTVNNATPTNTGDYIFLTGNTVELGNWGTTFNTAVGPMLDPNYPNWFLNVSVPAGQSIQFKFIKIAADGSVTWENGTNHTFTVPTSGESYVNVNWQY